MVGAGELVALLRRFRLPDLAPLQRRPTFVAAPVPTLPSVFDDAAMGVVDDATVGVDVDAVDLSSVSCDDLLRH